MKIKKIKSPEYMRSFKKDRIMDDLYRAIENSSSVDGVFEYIKMGKIEVHQCPSTLDVFITAEYEILPTDLGLMLYDLEERLRVGL